MPESGWAEISRPAIWSMGSPGTVDAVATDVDSSSPNKSNVAIRLNLAMASSHLPAQKRSLTTPKPRLAAIRLAVGEETAADDLASLREVARLPDDVEADHWRQAIGRHGGEGREVGLAILAASG